MITKLDFLHHGQIIHYLFIHLCFIQCQYEWLKQVVLFYIFLKVVFVLFWIVTLHPVDILCNAGRTIPNDMKTSV